jgi:hypothetical protein
MKLKSTFGLVLLALSSLASADALYAKTVKSALVNMDSGVHFRTNEAMQNPDSCEKNGWYRIKSDGQYHKAALSILLTAQASGKRVAFSLDGCDGLYPKVTWIYLDD